MSEPECVTRERLEKYVLGDLPIDDWQAIAAHVEACGRCEETVSQLDRAEDTLLKTLRGPAVSNSEPTVYRLAARRAKSLKLPPSVVAAPETAAAAQCLRDYELVEPIARGGMGTVYRAMHRRLRRQVAVKVLPQRCLANPHAVARFQREMQAVGQLRHPAIVQATDGGEVEGVHFLVMELIDGIDLSTLVKCVGPISPADACELARRTALGLAHAHEQGVIHRDVKPSNVMLTAEGEIKILDLGLARIVGEQLVCDELTTVGQLMGTLDYMAPEQFENSHHADERCDVYGLGATLFKLLAAHAPYSGSQPDSPLVKLRRIAGEPPPPLSTKRGGLSAELCSLVDRMLARCPEDRPASMKEVAAALEPWCSGHNLRDLALDGMTKQAAARRQQEQDGSDQNAAGRGIVPATPPEMAKVFVEPRASKPRSGRFKRVIAALLLVGLLVALGIVITLQTSGGQLVIETSVPDIEVRVVRAGQPFKTLTLTQTPNTLRLGAGDYEVQLVGPADGLQVENNRFTLTRGQTVIARVVHAPPIASAPSVTATGTSPKPQLPEPRYDGKTTAEWIAILFEDRSPDRVTAAFDALEKLGLDQGMRDDAIKAIFHAARFHSAPVRRTSSSEKLAARAVWSTAIGTLRSFDDHSVVSHASTLLDDPAYRPKLFVLYLLRVNAQRYRSQLSGPLRNQLLHFAEQGPDDQRKEAMEALAQLLGESDPQFVAICHGWLSASDDFGRLHAASWLIAAKQFPVEVVSVLRQMLKSATPEIRIEAVGILGDMGGEAKPAVPDLIAIVETPNQPLVNATAVQPGITSRRHPGSISRQPGITSPRSLRLSPQEQAIDALGSIGDSSAVPSLIREWRRRVALQESPSPENSTFSRRPGTRTVDFESTLVEAIEALTGLTYQSKEGWALGNDSLEQACFEFLNSAAGFSGTSVQQKSLMVIRQILLVATDSEVEQAVADAISRTSSNEPYTSRLVELVELLRPSLPPKSEYRALLGVLSRISKNPHPSQFETIKTLTLRGGLNGPVRSVQQLLTKRATESPEAQNQVFDAVAEAVESANVLDLVLYVDTLLALGVPDSERSKRIVAALEKARDPEIPWKTEAVNRGLEHLRGKPEDPKSPTR